MAENESVIITVPSVHHALKMERAFKRSGLTVEMIPVPRAISSDCGICASLAPDDLEEVLKLLGKHRIVYEEIWVCRDRRLTRYKENGPSDTR